MFKRLRSAFAPRPRAAEADIEWRTAFKSGVAGVFDPGTGRVEWRESFKGGVAGVFNPSTGRVEWETAFKTGICGVLRSYPELSYIDALRAGWTFHSYGFYGDDD